MRYVVVWLLPNHGDIVDLHDDADRARWSEIEHMIAKQLTERGLSYAMGHYWEEAVCEACQAPSGGNLLCNECAGLIDFTTEELLEKWHFDDLGPQDWYE